MTRESAGVLLYRVATGSPQALLVHPGGPLWARKDDGAWSLPKGEVEPGETPREVAARELEEETGIVLTLAERDALIELGSVRQRAGKVVHAWALERDVDPETCRSDEFVLEWPPRSGQLRTFPEVDRVEWFDLQTAAEKLNPAQSDFVERLRAMISP